MVCSTLDIGQTKISICFMAFPAHFHVQFFSAGHFVCAMKIAFRKSEENLVVEGQRFIVWRSAGSHLDRWIACT